MSKERIRRTTVRAVWIEARTSWSDAAIVIKDDNKEVRLAVEDPADLAYIRERLNEIEAYWRKQVGV